MNHIQSLICSIFNTLQSNKQKELTNLFVQFCCRDKRLQMVFQEFQKLFRPAYADDTHHMVSHFIVPEPQCFLRCVGPSIVSVCLYLVQLDIVQTQLRNRAQNPALQIRIGRVCFNFRFTPGQRMEPNDTPIQPLYILTCEPSLAAWWGTNPKENNSALYGV